MKWLFFAVFFFVLLLGVNSALWAYFLGAKRIAYPVILGINLATAQSVLFLLFVLSCFLLIALAIYRERVSRRKRAKRRKGSVHIGAK